MVDSCANITIISISHLTGTIDYAAHDADFKSLHAFCGFTDAGNRFAKIIECATAPRATDIFSLACTKTSSLQNAECRVGDDTLRNIPFVHEP